MRAGSAGGRLPAAAGCARATSGSASKNARGDRKSTRLNSSHLKLSRMPSSAVPLIDIPTLFGSFNVAA